jgi:hypothetical protein
LRAPRFWNRDYRTIGQSQRWGGHRDVNAAMRYQHPEVDIVRAALNPPQGLSTSKTGA